MPIEPIPFTRDDARQEFDDLVANEEDFEFSSDEFEQWYETIYG